MTASSTQNNSDVAACLSDVKAQIALCASEAGRNAKEVTLVAVGKTFDSGHIRPALEAGHRVFGENRVQEAASKWPALRADFPNIELHLIGSLQSNKASDAVALFDVIETVDRPKLARALSASMEKLGRRPACLIQVNTGAERQKSGVLPDDADSFIAECRDSLGLPVTGLMCIPPVEDAPALHFALLREIARRNHLGVLSMGMSADYKTAIAQGATHVRVGSAIFGARRPPPG